MISRFCKRFAFWVVLSAAAPLVSTDSVRADEKAAEQAAEAEAEGHGHGHHSKLTIKEIVSGEHSLQFWGAVVNFSLLVILIVVKGKKPVGAFLSSRRAGIERGISEAAEVKRAAELAFNTYTERMKSLDAELAKLRQDVAEAAERDRARIVAEANESVARLKAETDSLVKRQAEQLEAQIRREVVQAATDAAEQAVRELTSADDQRRLADAFTRELGKLADRAEEKRS